ncbi:mfs drug transporter [Diaporthe amygdali]|uniref:mfs drug transporter n=1 Tax=Phomopsis amygdali TaxID=1214568 RepID=UPI0022FE0729|nr:mfs drug transporter [Diaporthe amygdali]KAJ0120632.1 mfs drug transporter [Diaporthe amygdali]
MPKISIAHLLDYTAGWESLSFLQIVCTSRMSTGMVTNDEAEKGTPMPTDHTDSATAGPKYTDQSTRSLPPSKIITVFLACASVDFVALIDQTSLAASLSIVSSSLQAGTQASWIAGGYFITSTSFQLLYGRLSDVWSRKYVLLALLLVFFLGSLASSLSHTAIQLIIFRAIAGVGGGGLMTVAQVIVSDVVSLRQRGKYQGIFGAVVAVANGVGPLIGGALATSSSQGWRWIFRLNLPLTALCAVAILTVMPLKRIDGNWKEKLAKVDFFGCFLTLCGSILFMLGLTWAGDDYPWSSTAVILPIVLGFCTTVAFLLWQQYGTNYPLVPLYIFRQKMVNGACITMFINGWNFVAQVYYIPTFYQLAYGYSTVHAASLLLPLTLMQTFSSTLSGLIVTWRGRYRESILIGWAIWAVGLGLFSTLDQNSGLGKQIGYAILTGFGVGQTLQPSLIAIQAGVDKQDMAVVTGTRNFVRNLGSTIGLAVTGTIINNVVRASLISWGLGLSEGQIRSLLRDPTSIDGLGLSSDLHHVLLTAYHIGFQRVFYTMAALATLSVGVASILMPQIDLDQKENCDQNAPKT